MILALFLALSPGAAADLVQVGQGPLIPELEPQFEKTSALSEIVWPPESPALLVEPWPTSGTAGIVSQVPRKNSDFSIALVDDFDDPWKSEDAQAEVESASPVTVHETTSTDSELWLE